jgi:hypothetical protein
MEFTIYRDSWRRGGSHKTEIDGKTYLLNDQNKMCCLGQIAFQAGIPLAELMELTEPRRVRAAFADSLEAGSIGYYCAEDADSDNDEFAVCNSQLADNCMPINDDPKIDDAERERRLIEEFANKSEHRITFVDGIAPWFTPEVPA